MIIRTAASAARVKADVVVIPVVAGATTVPAELIDIDRALAGGLGALLTGSEFSGKLGATVETMTLGRLPAARVALIGMGERNVLDRVRMGNALQLGLRRLHGPIGSLAIAYSEVALADADPRLLAPAAVEAAELRGFTEATRRSKPAGRRGGATAARGVRSVTLAGFPRLERRALEAAAVIAEAANLARELVNAPASELTPAAFAAEARRQARGAGLRVGVLEAAELRRRGYGAILAVGSGSSVPPRLVVLRFAPAPRAGSKRARARRLALVGKGITFDTGGISIKPANDMHMMKGDMGGAAAVLAAMTAIGRLKPSIEVIGILCLAENMVSASAMRPGDVVKAGSGATIEVINTDAEGRMVLADGIHHAVEMGATHIVDIATLTGGQRIALGPVAAALQSDDLGLQEDVLVAAADAGERVWPMPTFAEYETMLESPIADLSNSPGPMASSITAGLFLRRFAGGRPWLHLDIAAPSWNRVASVKEIPAGPAGFGARTLAHLALTMGAKR